MACSRAERVSARVYAVIDAMSACRRRESFVSMPVSPLIRPESTGAASGIGRSMTSFNERVRSLPQ